MNLYQSSYVYCIYMRILFILPFFPYPSSLSGGHKAIFNGIKAICQNYDLYITFPEAYETDNKSFYGNFCLELGKKVHILPYKREPVPSITFRNRINIVLWNIWTRYLYYLIHFRKYSQPLLINPSFPLQYNEKFAEHVNNIVDLESIDIVQCEMIENLGLVQRLSSKVKKLFVHHELYYVRTQLKSGVLENDSVLLSLKKNEIDMLNLYDGIITLSQVDAQKLKACGVIRPIFPSFVSIDIPKVKCHLKDNAKVLSFVGPEFHAQNYDGLMWFLETCFKTLLSNDKTYRVQIIGKWSNKTKKSILQKFKHVQFLGFVEDLGKALNDTILIVPILYGSGIRIKILEACSLGVPFVSTTIGAEGIPVISGKNCFIADSPADFVASIIKLSDISIQSDFSQSSLQMIQQYYSMKSLRNNRIAIYDSIKE